MLKKLACLFLVVLMSIESFAAAVSDNDGAAFITKAEFDGLRNEFQKQLNDYNFNINNKIEAAIAEYLSAAKITNDYVLNNLYKELNGIKEIRWNSNASYRSNANQKTYFDQPTYYWNISQSKGNGWYYDYKYDTNKMVATTWKYDTNQTAYVEAMYKITPKINVYAYDLHFYDDATEANGTCTFTVPTSMTLESGAVNHATQSWNASEIHYYNYVNAESSTIEELNYVIYAPNSTATEYSYVKYTSQSNLEESVVNGIVDTMPIVSMTGTSKGTRSRGKFTINAHYPIELYNHGIVVRDKIFKPFYNVQPEYVSTIRRGAPLCLVEHDGRLNIAFTLSIPGQWEVYTKRKNDSSFTKIRTKSGSTSSNNQKVTVNFDSIKKDEVAYIIYKPTNTSRFGTIAFDTDIKNIGV